MAGGNAGEVAKAAAGKAEILGAACIAQQLLHIGKRQQVRQVRHGGKHRVVAGGVHPVGFGADRLPQRFHCFQAAFVLRFVRADHQFFAFKQPETRGGGTAAVRTGNRVRRHAARQMRGQMAAESRERRALGATDVADNRMRIQQRRQLAADRRQRGHWRGHQHQIGTAHRRRFDTRKRAVDHLPLQRPRQIVGMDVDAGYGLHPLLPLQIEHQRAADQTDADQGDLG